MGYPYPDSCLCVVLGALRLPSFRETFSAESPVLKRAAWRPPQVAVGWGILP